MKTIEWRNYLERIDPPAGAVNPGEVRATSWYESPGEGLVYGTDPNQKFDSRVDHVLNHTRRVVSNNDHGIIVTESPLETLDEVYRLRGTGTQTGNNIDVRVESGFAIPKGGDLIGPYANLPCTRLAVFDDVQVITAFPVATCP